MDQFVLAGEGQKGVFIGAWHNISLDTDVDGDDDIWAEGYSSTTLSHIGVLTMIDGNDIIRDAISPFLPAYPGISDGYGIEMVTTSCRYRVIRMVQRTSPIWKSLTISNLQSQRALEP